MTSLSRVYHELKLTHAHTHTCSHVKARPWRMYTRTHAHTHAYIRVKSRHMAHARTHAHNTMQRSAHMAGLGCGVGLQGWKCRGSANNMSMHLHKHMSMHMSVCTHLYTHVCTQVSSSDKLSTLCPDAAFGCFSFLKAAGARWGGGRGEAAWLH